MRILDGGLVEIRNTETGEVKQVRPEELGSYSPFLANQYANAMGTQKTVAETEAAKRSNQPIGNFTGQGNDFPELPSTSTSETNIDMTDQFLQDQKKSAISDPYKAFGLKRTEAPKPQPKTSEFKPWLKSLKEAGWYQDLIGKGKSYQYGSPTTLKPWLK